ncbi:MAG: PQQ-binding-like beta-propeller repeat protein [Thermoguttaceae bacterium]
MTCFLTVHAQQDAVVQWGGSADRNNVSTVEKIPESWNPGQFDKRSGKWIGGDNAKNIKWVSPVGSVSYATPIVAKGLVFCATNNKSGFDPAFPASVDLGVLVAYDAETGEFCGQFTQTKLDGSLDWPDQGLCSNPAVEKNRLWIVTNRSEVVCLDLQSAETKEFGKNVLWSFDMIGQLKTQPHNMTSCSPLLLGDLIFVGTSNGVGPNDKDVLAPNSPSFIALDKNSGELVWSDATPGENILDGQWGSPTAFVFKDKDGLERSQVLFPSGDGWLYAFDVKGRTITPSWKFDCNPKESIWKGHGSGDRNTLVATPVVAENRIFISTGQDPESGEGIAVLWCIEPIEQLEKLESQSKVERLSDRFVDLSAVLVHDSTGQTVPPRRLIAVDTQAGEQVVPNPLSAVRWSYQGRNPASKEFEDRFHRTLGSAVLCNDLLLIGDFSGVVHCLNAKTGECCWTYDMMSTIWGSPLAVSGKFFIADSDGDVAVFEQSPNFNLIEEINMGNSVYGSPVVSGTMIYIATSSNLFAIE